MKVHIDQPTVEAIRAFLDENKPETETLRIYIAGIG